MATKRNLVEAIISELKLVQVQPPKRPAGRRELWLPPTLPAGSEGQILVNDRLIEQISSFADLVMVNDPALAAAFTRKDLRTLARRAFGQALQLIDLDDSLEKNRELVLEGVHSLLAIELDRSRPEAEFLFGAWFLRGHGAHDHQIGPVRLEDRVS